MSSTNCSYKLLPINPSKRASLNSTIFNPFVFLSSPFFVFPALASLENKCTSRVGRWNCGCYTKSVSLESMGVLYEQKVYLCCM